MNDDVQTAPSGAGVTTPGGWRPPSQQLLYASGSFGFNVLHQTLALWLVYFYAPPPEAGRTEIVPLATFSLILTAGRLVEAVDDPLIGHWSDSTRSRWGRRLPFVVVGVLPLALTFVLLWLPPDGGAAAVAHALVTLQLYYLCVSLVQQPHDAILAESIGPEARVRTSAWRVTFGMTGALVGLVGSGLLIGVLGFHGMGIALAALAAASILLSALGIRRLPAPAPPERSPGMLEGLRLTATNRPFLVFMTSAVLFSLALNLLTQLLPYYVAVVLGQPDGQVALFAGLFGLVGVASLPLVGRIAAARGKQFAYGLAMAMLAPMLTGLFWVGRLPGIDPLVQGLAYIALLGVPMAALFVLPGPIVADIIDDEAARTGLRRAGIYSSAEVTLRKLGFALSTAIFGGVLAVFGYTAEAPLGIHLIGPIAGLGVLVGLLVFARGYRLPDQISMRRAARP